MQNETKDTKASAGQNGAIYNIGELVIVDGEFIGEITKHILVGNGSFYRVEVDTEKERHEFWTVKDSRLEHLHP